MLSDRCASDCHEGVLARYLIIPRIPLILMGDMTLIAGLFIIMKWAPAGTEKKVVTDTAVRVRMKQITIYSWSRLLVE